MYARHRRGAVSRNFSWHGPHSNIVRTRTRLRAGAVAGAAFAACHFAPTVTTDGHPGDVIPDASSCTAVSDMCLGDLLRSCTAIGGSATDQSCSWGCGDTPSPHCLELQPSGGAVEAGDLDGSGVVNTLLEGNLIVNGDTGAIGTAMLLTNIRGSGEGVKNGIGYVVRNQVAIFRFQQLQVSGTLALTGSIAIAFVADGGITIDDVIDARGSCGLTDPGPGGFPGGAAKVDATGSGAGTGGASDNNAGGGGGGHGGVGGQGGKNGGGNPAGGPTFGDATISLLVGGGGGGGGGGDPNAGRVGGGGGGAFQIVSNAAITIHETGGINAGGCGGKAGNTGQAASGGGAGGAILLEAPTITI